MYLSPTAIRPTFLKLHRYAGLSLAAFLVISGLTGSLMAFYHELDAWLNPDLFHASTEAGEALPPAAMVRRIEQTDSRIRVSYIPLGLEPGHAASASVDPRVHPATGELFQVDYNEVFIDPATGEILGKRYWGAFHIDRAHLMPFVYELHRRLHLPETWSLWLVGGVALLWMFDCFIGAYLTLPHGRPSFKGWGAAWKVKTNAGGQRLNYDLHRAGALWLWGLLLMIAVSGVSFNLHKEVFEPVVSFFSRITPSVFDTREMRPLNDPILTDRSFDEILARAKTEAEQRDWPEYVNGIFYAADFGVFGVGFGPEHALGLGSPWLYLDGQSGHPVDAYAPGTGTAGDIFHQLQYPLHSGQIAGLPGRIVICLLGLMVAMLSITGVVIWAKKRRVAVRQTRRRQAPARGVSQVAVGAAQR